jgi:hypothetical protein
VGARAGQVAEATGALIDGVYLREALARPPRCRRRRGGLDPRLSFDTELKDPA